MNKSNFFKLTFLSLIFVVGAITIVHAMMGQQAPSQGVLHERDKRGNPIRLEWVRYSQWSKQIFELQKAVTPIIAAASSNGFLTQLEKFRALSEEEKGAMDQGDREELNFFSEAKDSKEVEKAFIKLRMQNILDFEKKIVEEKNQPAAESPKDNYYIVIAKDLNGTILGFTEFNLDLPQTKPEPEDLPGSIELEPLMVSPHAQGRGLASLLIFSILKLNKKIKRIFLGTRKDNVKARAVYEHLGFKKYKEDQEHIVYKYLVPVYECDCPIL